MNQFEQLTPEANKNEEMPQLELKLLGTSKEKLINPNQKKPNDLVQSWGNYTIFAPQSRGTTGQIEIFDDKLQRLDVGLDRSLQYNIKHIINGFYPMGKQVNGRTRNDASNIEYADVKAMPVIYRKPVEKILFPEPNSSRYIGNNTTEQAFFGNIGKHFIPVNNGEYLIMEDEQTGIFAAYATKNEQGVSLPPKNWKKFSTSNAEEMPEELRKKVEEMLSSNEHIQEINDEYASLTTDVGINIVPTSDKKQKTLFSQELPSINNNISVDPTNKNVIYYCQEGTPNSIYRLDMSGDPSSWKPDTAKLPADYKEIKNLQLDPTGTFFLLYSENNLIMLTKDTLQEVKRVEGLTSVNFDQQGNIRGIDSQGHLVKYEVDSSGLAQALAKQKANKIGTGVNVEDIFAKQQGEATTYNTEVVENLGPIKEEWEGKVIPQVEAAATIQDVSSFRKALVTLRQTLRAQNVTSDQIQFITEGIENAVSQKEKEFAGKEAQVVIASVEAKLTGPITINSIGELRIELDKIKPIEGALELADRERVHQLAEEINKRATELFGRESVKIQEDLTNLIEGTRQVLDGIVNKNEFDDWMEFRFPPLKSKLGTMLHDCPVEAFEAANMITKSRNDLVTLSETYKKKFELEYAQVREMATERTDTIVQTLSSDVTGLAQRLESKQFKTREEAEQYLATSEARRVIEEEITQLEKTSPDAAKELARSLKVVVANTLGYIERGGSNVVAETGQQMVMFGSVTFPRFEGKVKEHKPVSVDVTFKLDDHSKGPGISPNQFYGDVELLVTNSKGEKNKVRMYESLDNEDEWRLGLMSYRGDAVPSSYVTAENFKSIKKDLRDWENGSLKSQDETYRKSITQLFESREKPKKGESRGEEDENWKKSYKEKINEYGKFCAENHILFFRRMDEVKKQNTIEENGKGYVPKWQNHWVADPTTEGYLEKMAENFKMQQDLQEGILNLYGHAGTGKDVLIKMFASKEKANRPYFATDCTKWTTEYELAEDVVLEAVDGATQTVRVPSAILTGIQTPGAIVYLNELNAMPEQAQIFLHALTDEKRALTLKTSSGKVVQAHPTVLLACSMNPGYPGTFDPQFATKSRMVSMEIDYPPLTREVKDGEPQGREKPYNASEPLRIARGVESLIDLTYEMNMDKNEFVQAWDKRINGINNDAPTITKSQEFDFDVIRALVQFSNKLRDDFKSNFDKTSTRNKNVLPVRQPITNREMRRCAYVLSNMSEADKLNKDSDTVARELIEEFFLTNIFQSDDRAKIDSSMKVWNSKNRMM